MTADGTLSCRIFRFTAAVAGLLAIWLVILPLAGHLPVVRSHLDRLDALHINAAAMFYTELDDTICPMQTGAPNLRQDGSP